MDYRIGRETGRHDGGFAFSPGIFQAALLCALACTAATPALSEEMQWLGVSSDRKTFVLEKSGSTFVPWGFNYDHDEQGRLIEDYWDAEWPKVEEDFREMKQLGANVVRIHLQLGKFISKPDEPNQATLDRLGRLVTLAERSGLYLDLTGLGCYHKKDVPAWYDALDEQQRWDVQARFWEAVAGRCALSPAIFCYDLMNEPVAPGAKQKEGGWLVGPPFAGKQFVQFVTLDPQDRPRSKIAQQWVHRLAQAIRQQDRRHLITVGLLPGIPDRADAWSGFDPQALVDDLDFISVHVYPEKGQVDQALKILSKFSVGRPVVIEETFPLRCSTEELAEFIDQSRKCASGWIGFYWGKTPEECRQSKQLGDALTLGWLELFQQKAKTVGR